jgi:ribosomal protein L37AE/L43A
MRDTTYLVCEQCRHDRFHARVNRRLKQLVWLCAGCGSELFVMDGYTEEK